MFVDTNIISRAKKGRSALSTRGTNISSVTASELLLIYNGRRTAANYYVPVVSTFHLMTASLGSFKRDHPFPKRFTDRITFSFGQEFEPIVEYGSVAVAKMVNERNVKLLRQSIAFLDKEQQRLIREDFAFLVENEICCAPLTTGVVTNAYGLLHEYRASGGNLKADFRNSWNDMLILSTAQSGGGPFFTADAPGAPERILLRLRRHG